MHAYEVKQDRIIISEGSEKAALGFVIKGKLNIAKKDEKNNYVTLSTLNSSQSFGEMSFIDGQPASARVTTATDTLLLILTRKRFEDLVDENSALALELVMIIAQMLSHKLRNTSGKLVDFLGENS
jgi:CRP-like cAMP-binding protein